MPKDYLNLWERIYDSKHGFYRNPRTQQERRRWQRDIDDGIVPRRRRSPGYMSTSWDDLQKRTPFKSWKTWRRHQYRSDPIPTYGLVEGIEKNVRDIMVALDVSRIAIPVEPILLNEKFFFVGSVNATRYCAHQGWFWQEYRTDVKVMLTPNWESEWFSEYPLDALKEWKVSVGDLDREELEPLFYYLRKNKKRIIRELQGK